MKENKQYRLKKWYPSLGIHAVEGIIIERKYPYNLYVFGELCIPKHEVENNPDFWEEVKDPLFISDDGVEITDESQMMTLVASDFIKFSRRAKHCTVGLIEATTKIFAHESSAYEYILNNKRLFTFEEMKKANIDINWCTADIYYKAKERSKQ